jgi:hypothetical protein
VGLLGAATAACSGSEGSSSTTTTVGVTTGTGDPALGRLADLDGSLDGLSGGQLDCYRTSMAFLALTLTPVGIISGADPAGLASIDQDLATLRAQVPAAVAADFDTYAAGVQAFAAALNGVDLTDLQSATTRQQLVAAQASLETTEVKAAEDAIQRWFSETCPAPGATTTTVG